MMTPEGLNQLYWLVGVLVVFNLGTIGSILYFGGRIVWWASKIDHRVTQTEAHTEDHCEEIKQIRELILKTYHGGE